MIIFRNLGTYEALSHVEFVKFVWEEAERQFNECHDEIKWWDLTREEQMEQYCEQYEHQLMDMDWTMCEQ